EVNRDAPAHAVTTHRHSFFSDRGLLEQKPPTLGEHASEFRVRRFGLNGGAADDMRRLGITQLLEYIDGKSRITELGKFPCLGLNIFAQPAFRMDQKQRRTGL